MKFEVRHRQDGSVEIRIREEGGKITVWLCQDAQAALFKLAQILSFADDPKETRRSILVGTFQKKRELTEIQDKLLREIKKEMKKAGYTEEVEGPLQPNPLAPPAVAPFINPGGPYVAPPGTITQPWIAPGVTGTGTAGGNWGGSTTDGTYTTTTSGSGGTLWVNYGQLAPSEKLLSSNGNVTTYVYSVSAVDGP